VAAVLTETVGPVRLAILNRPARRNAIDPELAAGLLAAIRAAEADPAIGALVLAGEGAAFCAGLDLKFAATCDEAAMRALVADQQAVARALLLSAKPVVAAVQGYAVGGGFETALAADFIIAADDMQAWFPEAEKGLFITGGITLLLPRLVGLPKARELALLGRRQGAADLDALGLLHEVAPAAEIRRRAVELATDLAGRPAAGVLKLALNRACLAQLDEVLAREAEAAIAGARRNR
jgi:enoyl-CoA hydratase/carnithine racemase